MCGLYASVKLNDILILLKFYFTLCAMYKFSFFFFIFSQLHCTVHVLPVFDFQHIHELFFSLKNGNEK